MRIRFHTNWMDRTNIGTYLIDQYLLVDLTNITQPASTLHLEKLSTKPQSAHLHLKHSPRTIIGHRRNEEIPHWMTHALEKTYKKGYLAHLDQATNQKDIGSSVNDPVIDMKDVNMAHMNC